MRALLSILLLAAPAGGAELAAVRSQAGIRLDGRLNEPAWRDAPSTTFGAFYSDRLTQSQNSIHWTAPRSRFQTALTVEQNFGRLREANFVQRIWQLQTAFAWNANLSLASFLQYDSESGNLGTNTRLRWTVKPGRDLFIVWNRGWQRLLTSRDDLRLAPDSVMVAVKLRWTFRP